MSAFLDHTMLLAVFTAPDYIVLVLYVAAVVVLGSWLARGQSTLGDYFLAGRNMPWFVVCISIIATDLSAISYMGVPAWLYRHDLKYNVGIVLMPLVMFLVLVIFVKLFHRFKVFTVYEYLESRFHPLVRSVTAGLFLFQRGVWLAGAIYIPSLALSTVSGLPVMGCILAVGLLATLYTVLGGMKAVVWTDFLQFFVLFGGLSLMILILLGEFHWDLPAVWARAGEMTAVDTQTPHTRMIDCTFDLKTEATVWALLFFYLIYNMGTYGTDQVIVQRYFTMGTYREIAKSIMTSSVVNVLSVVLLALFGLLLVVYYDSHPEVAASLTNPDQILPHFVSHALPAGIRGLILAGLFAATMAAVDSGFNSFSTVGVMDLYRRHVRGATQASEAHNLKIARICTLLTGVFTTLVAVWISMAETTILQTIVALASKFIGPISGIFFLGALTKRTCSLGALVGAVVGLTAAWAVDWGPIKQNVNWLWTAPLGCLVTFIVGYATSFVVSVATVRNKRAEAWCARQKVRGEHLDG